MLNILKRAMILKRKIGWKDNIYKKWYFVFIFNYVTKN